MKRFLGCGLSLGLLIVSSSANALEDLESAQSSKCMKAINKATHFDEARLWDPFKLSFTAEFSPGSKLGHCDYKVSVNTREGAAAARALMTNEQFGRCRPVRYRKERLTAESKARWLRINNQRREMASAKEFAFSLTGVGHFSSEFASEVPGLSLAVSGATFAVRTVVDNYCPNRKAKDVEITLDTLLSVGGFIYQYVDKVVSADGDHSAIRETFTYETNVGDEWRVTPILVRFTPVKVVR